MQIHKRLTGMAGQELKGIMYRSRWEGPKEGQKLVYLPDHGPLIIHWAILIDEDGFEITRYNLLKAEHFTWKNPIRPPEKEAENETAAG